MFDVIATKKFQRDPDYVPDNIVKNKKAKTI